MLLRINSEDYEFEFNLRRKITIVRGLSGDGKTALYNLVRQRPWSLTIDCPLHVAAASEEPKRFTTWAEDHLNEVVIIDEDLDWVKNGKFWETIADKNIWIILINRDTVDVKYDFSVNEIYNIKRVGKKRTLEPYFTGCVNSHKNLDHIITEDSRSGHDFFSRLTIQTDSSNGKDGVPNKFEEYGAGNTYVVDGAAFARLYDPLYIEAVAGNIDMIIPECFEEMLLKSSLFKGDEEVQKALCDPEKYGANNYGSWEKFYENLLVQVMDRPTRKGYNKKRLSHCFGEPCCERSSKCDLYEYGSHDKIKDTLICNDLDYLVPYVKLSNADLDLTAIRAVMPPYIANTATDEEVVDWYTKNKELGLL